MTRLLPRCLSLSLSLSLSLTLSLLSLTVTTTVKATPTTTLTTTTPPTQIYTEHTYIDPHCQTLLTQKHVELVVPWSDTNTGADAGCETVGAISLRRRVWNLPQGRVFGLDTVMMMEESEGGVRGAVAQWNSPGCMGTPRSITVYYPLPSSSSSSSSSGGGNNGSFPIYLHACTDTHLILHEHTNTMKEPTTGNLNMRETTYPGPQNACGTLKRVDSLGQGVEFGVVFRCVGGVLELPGGNGTVLGGGGGGSKTGAGTVGPLGGGGVTSGASAHRGMSSTGLLVGSLLLLFL